jgi:hypothetical protein
MITIPLSTNLDGQSLLKSIQELINLYNKDGNDISQHVLVIEVKPTVSVDPEFGKQMKIANRVMLEDQESLGRMSL